MKTKTQTQMAEVTNKTDFEQRFEEAKKFFKDKNFIIEDKKLKSILACIEMQYPLLIVGPTGTGKTLFLTLLAEFLQGNYEYVSLNGAVTIHDLTQERILDKNGCFIERDMVLARWLRSSENRPTILHMDEVNAARPETLLALHPIMDIKGELNLPYSNEILKLNKNSILVMSANEGDEYVGIQQMNAAFQNRYVKIHMNYLEGDELAKLLSTKTNVSMEHAKLVVKVWEKYMNSREPENPIISTRLLERWCNLSHLLGLKDAGLATFGSLISEDEEELIKIEHGDFFVNLHGA